MNVGIARPSSGRIRGPNVLKIRTMPVSTPWVARYAIVSASPKRFASSYTPRGPTGFTWPQYVSGCGWICGSPYTSEVDASRKRAPFSRASPSVCRVPIAPTFSVAIGSRR
jgi:hypothetical protein